MGPILTVLNAVPRACPVWRSWTGACRWPDGPVTALSQLLRPFPAQGRL